MSASSELWLSLGAILVLAAIAGLLVPSTRPIVRKWGWLLLAPLGMILGAALVGSRRPPGSRDPSTGSPTPGAVDAIRKLGDEALARSAAADSELARSRLEARSLDSGGAELSRFDEEMGRIRQIQDPARRRAELARLVEGTRGEPAARVDSRP